MGGGKNKALANWRRARGATHVAMDSLFQDLRFALRTLVKRPGFTMVVILILAGGIGVTTAIFSIVNAVLFSPLPFKDADRLVCVWEGSRKSRFSQTISSPNFLDLKAQNQVFSEMALFADDAVTLTGGAEPERLAAIRSSVGTLSFLGLKPALGRPLTPEEYSPGRDRVALLSHGLWQRRFGSRPDIVGQTLTLNGEPYTVAGVLSADSKMGLILGFEPELWMPLGSRVSQKRDLRSFLALARLKPGVALERAQADLSVIARRLEKAHPDANSGWTLHVANLRAGVDPVAYVLLILVVCSVMGIVSANVANLLLARASQREKEMAIRVALGAGRWRVVRQLLTESLFYALLGSGLGLLMAFEGCKLIKAMSRGTNLGLVDVHIDAQVLAATLLVTLLTALAIGVAPALQASKIHLNESLKEGGEGFSPGSTKRRLKTTLVVSEVALSIVLLSGAGLATKSLLGLLHIDPGFRPENVLTMNVSLSDKRYSEPFARVNFSEQLLDRLGARSEVQSAAIASSLPTAGPSHAFTIRGRPVPTSSEEFQSRFISVSPQYFSTLTIPVKAGRAFTGRDGANDVKVAIINEAMARKYWVKGNPLGAQIEVAGDTRTVVGIVGDVRSAPLSLVPVPEIYVPHAQFASGNVFLLVRTRLDKPLGIVASVKKEIQSLDRNQPVTQIQTMVKALQRNMGVISVGTYLLAGLGLGALLLTAVGIYSVLSYLVSQRTREFGIRMALGAGRGDVLGMVLKQGLTPIFLGVVIGLPGALALGRVLSSRVYGLAPNEPMVLVAVSLLLTGVALLASYVPARRATKVDPMVALRYE